MTEPCAVPGHPISFYMYRLKPAFLLILVFAKPVLAQYEHLLHKPYSQKVLGIHEMYRDLIDTKDSVQRIEKAEVIKNFARNNNDRSLELNVDFFLVYWSSFHQRQAREVSLRKLTTQLEESGKENVDFLRERSLRALAEFYWGVEKNYELAFEYYLLLDSELAMAQPEDYPEMARDFMQIGKAYYFFQDYSIAIEYFKKAIVLPETTFTTMVINDARNTLGLCYQELNQLDSSDYYLNQVLINPFQEAMVWKRIATGNLGANMYLRKQYDKALPLLETDFNSSLAENDYGCAAGASILMADIFREKGQMEKASEFIAHAKANISKAEQPERLRLLYPVMSKWYADRGDAWQSKEYMDSALVAVKRYTEKFSALRVLRAQQKVDRQKDELRSAAFDLERQQKIAERNLLVLLVFILCIFTVFTYIIQRKRQLAKDLKLKAARQELEIATQELQKFTEKILEKNKLIEQMQSRVSGDNSVPVFQELLQSTILTDDDWSSFQLLFDKVYPGFVPRVKEKLPELSIGDLRYFALCRLNLSNKEMAAMLGVSANTLHVTSHRIRKKLKLSDNNSLEELIRTI